MSNPIVTIEMENGGIIRAELYPEVAPNTVRNFVSLAGKGFYDGTPRVCSRSFWKPLWVNSPRIS